MPSSRHDSAHVGDESLGRDGKAGVVVADRADFVDPLFDLGKIAEVPGLLPVDPQQQLPDAVANVADDL